MTIYPASLYTTSSYPASIAPVTSDYLSSILHQYKAYGHFKTLIVDNNKNEEWVSGVLKMQFETKKK